jgi:hypothetical protein
MVDLVIVAAFVAYAVWAGLSARRKASSGLQEYFLAGRSVKGWRAGVSMAATQFAADTPPLVTGLIASGGIFLIWQLWVSIRSINGVLNPAPVKCLTKNTPAHADAPGRAAQIQTIPPCSPCTPRCFSAAAPPLAAIGQADPLPGHRAHGSRGKCG